MITKTSPPYPFTAQISMSAQLTLMDVLRPVLTVSVVSGALVAMVFSLHLMAEAAMVSMPSHRSNGLASYPYWLLGIFRGNAW